jgi:hypothetical protein
MPPMLEHQIRERAYFIWIAKGCPQGQDEQNWIAAEHELRTAEDCATGGRPVEPAASAKRRRAMPNAKAAKPRANHKRQIAASASAEAR